MVYDCFSFNNELDILEIRLATLDEVVDVFVLVEATQTHTGQPKKLHYKENAKRFAKWAHKIRHVVVDDMPDEPTPDNTLAWTRERFQRSTVWRAFTKDELAGDHHVWIGDVDEIPDPKVIRDIVGRNAAEHVFLPQHVYYLNWAWRDKVPGSISTCAPMSVWRQRDDLHDLIFDKHLAYQVGADKGWHFAYMGGARAILMKIRANAHEELDDPTFTSLENIEEALRSGKDLFHRDRPLVEVPLGQLPQCIQDDPKRYAHMLHHEPDPSKRLPRRMKQHSGGTIAVPTNETLRFTDFAMSLTSLHAPPGTGIVWQKGSSIVRNRNALVRTFTGDWIWFMDDDHKFPPTTLWQLLDHEVDVVVPLCFKRYYPYQPVIYTGYRPATETEPEGHIHAFLDEYKDGGLIEIYAAGTAGMLVRRHVLEAIADPWFEDHLWGEDLSFCKKVRDAGFKIYCDLDTHLGHMNVYTIWPTRHQDTWGITLDTGSKNGQFFIPTEDYMGAQRAQKEADDLALGAEPVAKIERKQHRGKVQHR